MPRSSVVGRRCGAGKPRRPGLRDRRAQVVVQAQRSFVVQGVAGFDVMVVAKTHDHQTIPSRGLEGPVAHGVGWYFGIGATLRAMKCRVDARQQAHQLVQGPHREVQFKNLPIFAGDLEHESFAGRQHLDSAEFNLIDP